MNKRQTVQKNIIIDTVTKMCIHPTALEVYQEIIINYPSISKATVYRNLKELVMDGIIRKIEMPSSPDRYDFNNHNHYHLECLECREVKDSYIDYFSEINKQAATDDFTVLSHDIVFKGICNKCQTRKGKV